MEFPELASCRMQMSRSTRITSPIAIRVIAADQPGPTRPSGRCRQGGAYHDEHDTQSPARGMLNA